MCIRDSVHPDDRKFLVPRLKMEQLLLRHEFELPLRIRRMDGTYLPMLVKGKGIKNNETGLVTHTLLVFNQLPTHLERQKSEGMTWRNKMIQIE